MRAGRNGTLLVNTTQRDFFALDISSGLRREWTLDGRIWGMDGPDRRGRCVYAVHRGAKVDLVLHDLRSDETSVIASYRGSKPYWYLTAFRALTLSPDGELVAFSREHAGNEWDERYATGSGSIQVLRTDGELVAELEGTGFENGMDWHPTERRLVVCRFFAKDELPSGVEPTNDDEDGRSVLVEYDLDHERWKPLVQGSRPRFSPDGGALLFERGDEALVLDMATGGTRDITAPGWKWPIALLEGGAVLYAGLPTTGAEQGILRTLQKSPQRMWTVKLAEESGDHFCTLLPEVARFHGYCVGSEL